ncbi:MAG: aldehyde dehydrogenase family protein [Vallitaleaceae bacterium]|nr:aldehyde dehydrogenase family protein [Vallitaleaceae bacterium]
MIFHSYINGILVKGDEGESIIKNPGTEEAIAYVSMISAKQADDALKAAEEGFNYWSKLTQKERESWILMLYDNINIRKDEILELLMNETGKLYKNAEEDFQMLLDCLVFYNKEAQAMEDEIIKNEEGSHHNIITREPVGVVLAYLAWNFPLLNLGYKLGPALASGCSCVIKPSMTTPLATLKIGEILNEISFPKGVINIISGDVMKLSHILNQSKIPSLITLIGSTATGKKIVADSVTSIKRFSLELGGNAPALVLKDYDPVLAAKTITTFKFENCGQVCVSPNRVFVHENQYEQFVSVARKIANCMKPGWGKEEGATISPLMTAHARVRMLEVIEDALKKGATLISGGGIPNDKMKGYYLSPTILGNVTKDMRCYKEEIFGPIMPIIKYNDKDNLIDLGNDTEYGLTSYIFSNDIKEIHRISKGLETGTVCVNKPLYSVELPHGGTKESGVGKDCSKLSLEEYYYIKRISIEI